MAQQISVYARAPQASASSTTWVRCRPSVDFCLCLERLHLGTQQTWPVSTYHSLGKSLVGVSYETGFNAKIDVALLHPAHAIMALVASKDWTLSLVNVSLAHGGLLCALTISRIELQRMTTWLLIRRRVGRSIQVARRVRVWMGARRRGARLIRRSAHGGCCCGVWVM